MFRPTLAVLVCLGSPALADRILAEATCVATDGDLRFHCQITLVQGGAPLDGAAFTVKTDMPSMPMAHNTPPVAAVATRMPGTYAVDLDLQMPGDWRLTLDISAPQRDRLVLPHAFDAAQSEHAATQDGDHCEWH